MSKSQFLAQYGSEDHVGHLLDTSHDQYVKEAALKNPALSKERMDAAVVSKHKYIRSAVANNRGLHPEHIEKLVHDPDDDVRVGIAGNHNLKPEHVEKLMKDSSDWVPVAMVNNPRVTKEHAQMGYDNLKNLKSGFRMFFHQTVKTNLGHDVV